MMKQVFDKSLRATAMAALVFSSGALTAADASSNSKNHNSENGGDETQEIKTLSKAFGNFIGKNLKNPGIPFDLDIVIEGIRDGASGKSSPISDEEYQTLLMKYQAKAFTAVSDKNLKEAEDFLANNKMKKGVQELEDGKLQYMIIENGHGESVGEHDTPKFNYVGTFLNGQEFGNSEKVGGPITIPLDQTIPGFRKGIAGMKEGEKRRLFIHPELGYGTSGQLPPNSLLIFDIQVVDANAPSDHDDGEDKDVEDKDDDEEAGEDISFDESDSDEDQGSSYKDEDDQEEGSRSYFSPW